MNRKWCKHISWQPHVWMTRFAIFKRQYMTLVVPRSWKCCPICCTPRPTRRTLYLEHFLKRFDDVQKRTGRSKLILAKGKK